MTHSRTRNGAVAAVALLLSAVSLCGWSRQLNDGVRLRTRTARSLRVDNVDHEHRVGLHAPDSQAAAGLTVAAGLADDTANLDAREPAPTTAVGALPRFDDGRQAFPFFRSEHSPPAVLGRSASPRGPPALA